MIHNNKHNEASSLPATALFSCYTYFSATINNEMQLDDFSLIILACLSRRRNFVKVNFLSSFLAAPMTLSRYIYNN
jgi:hypothetical protein